MIVWASKVSVISVRRWCLYGLWSRRDPKWRRECLLTGTAWRIRPRPRSGLRVVITDLLGCLLSICVLNIERLPDVKWPVETGLAALSADSLVAIHSCHCIISAFPRSWKFSSRRWQWHGRRSDGVVPIRVHIQENISICCSCVKPSILWWMLPLRKIHCLWVRFRGESWEIEPSIFQDLFVVSIVRIEGGYIQGKVL